MINPPQTFVGLCKSLETIPYGQNGKSLQKLTLEAERNVKEKNGGIATEWFDVPFYLFGPWAALAQREFAPGREACVWSNVSTRVKNNFTNLNFDVVKLAIYDHVTPGGHRAKSAPPAARPVPKDNAPEPVLAGPDSQGDDVPF